VPVVVFVQIKKRKKNNIDLFVLHERLQCCLPVVVFSSPRWSFLVAVDGSDACKATCSQQG
jgi:hypothetical protein